MSNTADIVAAARSWVGTPYHTQQRLKGVGVDCGQLVAGVAEETGIIPHVVIDMDYSPEWNIHNREEKMLKVVTDLGCQPADGPAAGRIVAFKIGRAYGHLGIMTSDITFVHAFLERHAQGSKNGFVTEVYLSGEWAKMDKLYFTYPEKSE